MVVKLWPKPEGSASASVPETASAEACPVKPAVVAAAKPVQGAKPVEAEPRPEQSVAAKTAEPKTPKTWKGWKEGIIQNSEVPSAVTKDNQEVWPSIHDTKVEGKRPNSIITIIIRL